MSRCVGGVINLMYSRYEKFKKWMTQPPLSWPAGRSGVVLNKAARIIHKNDLPIGAAAAQGVPTVLHLEELIAQGFDPRSAVEELRRRKRC
jgi:hypothetical protein